MSAKNQPPESDDADQGTVRLQKVLAWAGFGSRRHCEEYIKAGRVTVDGQPAYELGVCVDPRRQKIQLDGEPVNPQRKSYYLLNKPPGYLCTNRDPAGRARVIDLFPQDGPRLFTVGRLDENSQGLLLVTNDGELANRLAHPRYHIPRTYHVQVAGKPQREQLEELKRGVHFAEGKFRVKGIRRIRTQGNSTFLEIVLTEGQNREIRRMLARIGHKVLHLERVSFGPLHLGRLPLGRFRPLKTSELNLLREYAAGKRKPDAEERGARSSAGRPSKKKGTVKSAPAGKSGRNRRNDQAAPAGEGRTRSVKPRPTGKLRSAANKPKAVKRSGRRKSQ
jgi:23S rRNA pseudouridine2605 synthase